MALAEDILSRPAGFAYETARPTVVASKPVRINAIRVTETKERIPIQTGYSTAVHRSFLFGVLFVTISGCLSLFGVISENDAFSLAGALILPVGLFGFMNWIVLANGERSKKLDR